MAEELCPLAKQDAERQRVWIVELPRRVYCHHFALFSAALVKSGKSGIKSLPVRQELARASFQSTWLGPHGPIRTSCTRCRGQSRSGRGLTAGYTTFGSVPAGWLHVSYL